MELTFPAWLRVTHVLTALFLSLLVRSGIEILAAHPKLYWSDHAHPGREWLRFTRKTLPRDRLWTSKEEEEDFSPWIALPGHHNLGLGRYWHFLAAAGWTLTGTIYVALLAATGEWQRVIPTDVGAFGDAIGVAVGYLTLQPPERGATYNALQQLTYAFVIFVLGPLSIATGAAMSPAVAARLPWYAHLFGGRQAARSLHFLTLIVFVVFTVGHTALVLSKDATANLELVVIGTQGAAPAAAVLGSATILAAMVAFHVVATTSSLRSPRRVRRALGYLVDPLERTLLWGLRSRQRYTAPSPYFRVNGLPPAEPEYQRLAAGGFREWRLRVRGLVERELDLSLDDLRALPAVEHGTTHTCIQGWTARARWRGVPMSRLLAACRPFPEARYVVLTSMELPPQGHGHYYECIDIETAMRPDCYIAYEMNGAPLPLEHGAPARLRLETALGFKMVKFLDRVDLIVDPARIGQGQGGWREDVQHYGRLARI